MASIRGAIGSSSWKYRSRFLSAARGVSRRRGAPVNASTTVAVNLSGKARMAARRAPESAETSRRAARLAPPSPLRLRAARAASGSCLNSPCSAGAYEGMKPSAASAIAQPRRPGTGAM